MGIMPIRENWHKFGILAKLNIYILKAAKPFSACQTYGK